MKKIKPKPKHGDRLIAFGIYETQHQDTSTQKTVPKTQQLINSKRCCKKEYKIKK